MKTIIVNKAQPVTYVDQTYPAMIRITADLPDLKTLEEAARVYDCDAAMLEETLYGSLPGGTYDRLLGLMLKRKSSHFAVAHGA